ISSPKSKATSVLQQLLDEMRAQLPLELVERTLLRRFVRPPAEQPGAVAEAVAGEVVVGDFDHQRGPTRIAFAGPFRAPAAWASGSIACETRWRDQCFQAACQLRALGIAD